MQCAGRPVDAPFQKVVGQLRSAEANRPRSKLVDPSDLPRREKNVRRVEESFWHQAASGHSNPIKKRRKQTLKRSAEKAAPMGKARKRYSVNSPPPPRRPPLLSLPIPWYSSPSPQLSHAQSLLFHGNGSCRKRIRKASGGSESSGSEFEPSADSASDISFESEAGHSSEEGEADVSGLYDDADLDQYNQASTAWMSISQKLIWLYRHKACRPTGFMPVSASRSSFYHWEQEVNFTWASGEYHDITASIHRLLPYEGSSFVEDCLTKSSSVQSSIRFVSLLCEFILTFRVCSSLVWLYQHSLSSQLPDAYAAYSPCLAVAETAYILAAQKEGEAKTGGAWGKSPIRCWVWWGFQGAWQHL